MVSQEQNQEGHALGSSQSEASTGKKPRGFASMDAQKRREIASKGGKAAHRSGHAHEFTTEEAREAGRKGGQIAHERGTAHEFTPQEAQKAGRKGALGHRRKDKKQAIPPGPEQASAADESAP